jgi:hypothetical protein
MHTTEPWRRIARVAVPGAMFALALAARIRGISAHFWLLGDQIRDWGIALRPFADLPLVGPPTHVHGYTIGPAYYWIMWAIRVTVGPWFDNLPHGGGIGQAIVESAADALLLVAIWRRTGSVWIAVASVVAIATASYDLALSAIVWTTVVASALGKMAIALVLLNWHRAGPSRVALIAALAWSAVHVYTGAVFVTVSVFGALLADPIARREWRAVQTSALTIAIVVAAMQIPYVVYQVQQRFSAPAMGAVTGSVWRILSGSEPPEVAKSVAGYAGAFEYIQIQPWDISHVSWALLACGALVAVRYRRDPVILLLTLAPQAAAIVGYALFLGPLDHYYYIPVIPVAVLTAFLAVAGPPSSSLGRAIGVALLAAVVSFVPARLQFAATLHRLPEYAVLVDASRRIVSMRQPMRAILTEFTLPPTSDSEFIFTVLGGRIDRAASWVAIVSADGRVSYRRMKD